MIIMQLQFVKEFLCFRARARAVLGVCRYHFPAFCSYDAELATAEKVWDSVSLVHDAIMRVVEVEKPPTVLSVFLHRISP